MNDRPSIYTFHVRSEWQELRTLDQRSIDWLLAHNVPSTALAYPEALKHAKGEITDGLFDATADGSPHIAILETWYGDPHDIVYWQPHVERVGTCLGRAAVLGFDNIANPGTFALGGALEVHRSPLYWLLGGRRGAVILKRELVHHLLRECHRIFFEDIQHAEEIERAFNQQTPKPEFLVPADSKAA